MVRKFIESSAGMTPCIYNGLPLRPEFRVFYDFDARKPIFTANYWDYDYVYPHLYHATDKIIFEHERGKDWKACMHTSRMPFRTRSLMQCRMCKD